MNSIDFGNHGALDIGCGRKRQFRQDIAGQFAENRRTREAIGDDLEDVDDEYGADDVDGIAA